MTLGRPAVGSGMVRAVGSASGLAQGPRQGSPVGSVCLQLRGGGCGSLHDGSMSGTLEGAGGSRLPRPCAVTCPFCRFP